MKKFEFGKGKWDVKDFRYVYSPINRPGAKFTQRDDCVANRPNDAKEKFEYISMLCEDELKEGTLISTNCSFDHFGAPLIVFSDDIVDGDDGEYRYRKHFEVVAYERGLNVWRLDPVGDIVKPTQLLGVKFPVTEGEPHLLTTRVFKDHLEMTLDGHEVTLHGDFPEKFRAGITACEGINCFYDLTIDEEVPEKK